MIKVDGYMGRETIAALQEFLTALGIYSGGIDGVINGLPENSEYSATVAALQTLLNKGVESVTITAINLG